MLTEVETFKRLNKQIADHYLNNLKSIIGTQKRVEYALETEDFEGFENWDSEEFTENLAKTNDHLVKLFDTLKKNHS